MCSPPPPPNFVSWSPNPHVMVFGAGPVGGKLDLHEVQRPGLPCWAQCPYRKRKMPELSQLHSEKVTLCKPGRGASPDPRSGSTLILNFPAPRTVRINVCWLKTIQWTVFYYGSLNTPKQKGRRERWKRKKKGRVRVRHYPNMC